MTQNSPARLNDSLVGVVRLGSCFIGNVTKLRFFTMWDGEEGHLVALEWSLQDHHGWYNSMAFKCI